MWREEYHTKSYTILIIMKVGIIRRKGIKCTLPTSMIHQTA